MSELHISRPKESLSQIHPAVLLSIIVPFYNEQEVLEEFHSRLAKVLDSLPITSEIVYVDDGSKDNSLDVVSSFTSINSSISVIGLSRNFGKESAMSAGLEHCRGQAVILLDADLQDPPELIPQMIAKWREGYDVVNMQRRQRDGETWFKKFSAASFYKVMNAAAKVDVPENVGDFRLLSREVVDHINQLPERNRYMKGIFSWPGFRQATIQFNRDARFCGETKWNYLKLIGLAMDGITSFSIRPLRIATAVGGLVALSAFIYGMVIVFKTMMFGEPITGYPSMMVVQLALGGIQLLSIGLMGEYIGRIFIETKNRPLYLIQSVVDTPALKTHFKLEESA
ncbi:Polymyxin resistance protein ArnC, glycosyl transferase [Vibrio chagasii]|uniref:glycosyltransferase family 2 protein n=1 Tax=Vibrio chagasii TaxID=170679 RepID=UPI001EFC35F4|nr:glycosyltransferase family 2 protein [Vibrio chagasii]MCG9566429.1 glycosyltransferase family 2 protein [Vibrio chagasii]CAH6785191.1 Polymyxin resistance protein ArnC, glycosyl transferase [Vibrio chagasii]CAH6904929.1 Polymyxin resistance protein ArnC, glycosyl transferase [Vibrio chagasii]CAH6945054.1 Polymyxin resistance protein ArnC, glycosyl transferase [Vibrio chagasii]CAH6963431.1 Polymyxin resistance protein ArnC, glycosyl transferase [Vibrio chagasii]